CSSDLHPCSQMARGPTASGSGRRGRLKRSSFFSLTRKQRIELAGFVERVELIAAADMRLTNEHLRKRARPIGLLDHLEPQVALARRVDFLERHALAGQQLPRRVRVIAEITRV